MVWYTSRRNFRRLKSRRGLRKKLSRAQKCAPCGTSCGAGSHASAHWMQTCPTPQCMSASSSRLLTDASCVGSCTDAAKCQGHWSHRQEAQEGRRPRPQPAAQEPGRHQRPALHVLQDSINKIDEKAPESSSDEREEHSDSDVDEDADDAGPPRHPRYSSGEPLHPEHRPLIPGSWAEWMWDPDQPPCVPSDERPDKGY